MDPQSAISAPRFQYGDIYHYTGGTEVQLQPGIPDDVRAKLKADGYNIPDPGKQRNPAIGTTNIVTIDQSSGAYFGGAARLGRDFVAGY
jgi:gamma-glutamyltranspeptidase